MREDKPASSSEQSLAEEDAIFDLSGAELLENYQPPEDTWYTQWGYMEILDNERARYGDKEVQILNEAYNTYEAVLANEAVPVIQGRVTDGGGSKRLIIESGTVLCRRVCTKCIVKQIQEHHGNKGMLIFYEDVELNGT